MVIIPDIQMARGELVGYGGFFRNCRAFPLFDAHHHVVHNARDLLKGLAPREFVNLSPLFFNDWFW